MDPLWSTLALFGDPARWTLLGGPCLVDPGWWTLVGGPGLVDLLADPTLFGGPWLVDAVRWTLGSAWWTLPGGPPALMDPTEDFHGRPHGRPSCTFTEHEAGLIFSVKYCMRNLRIGRIVTKSSMANCRRRRRRRRRLRR